MFSVRMEVRGENWRGQSRSSFTGIFDGHPLLEGVPPEDRQRILSRVRKEQSDRYLRNLASQGGEYGGWADGPTYNGLVRTGSLMSYMTRRSIGEVTGNSVRFSMSNQGGSVWPVTHQEGDPNGFGRGINIPARRMWDLDPEDERRTEHIIRQEVSRLYGR
jgi:hypothetical protein